MTAAEFRAWANAHLTDNPYDRASAKVKEALAHNPIFDAHCHIFDRNCIYPGYFLLRLIKEKLIDDLDGEVASTEDRDLAESYYDTLQQSDQDSQNYQQIDEKLKKKFEKTQSQKLKGIIKGIRVFLGNRFDNNKAILDHYLDTFAITKTYSAFRNHKLISVQLMMDVEMGWKRRHAPVTDFREQMKQLLDLTIDYSILPFFAIDPRRPNLYELFVEAFSDPNKSFFGVKVYPAMGFIPNDDVLMPIFEICAAKKIPVLTHCGGSIISTFENRIDCTVNGAPFFIEMPDRRDLAAFLNEPERWGDVLARFPNLMLNFAHFGGNTAWEDTSDEYFPRINVIKNFMRTCPNVYADFSFNIISKKSYSNFKKALDNEVLTKERSMFGTDFWVVLTSGNLESMQNAFIEFMKPHHNSLFKNVPLMYLFGTLFPGNAETDPIPV